MCRGASTAAKGPRSQPGSCGHTGREASAGPREGAAHPRNPTGPVLWALRCLTPQQAGDVSGPPSLQSLPCHPLHRRGKGWLTSVYPPPASCVGRGGSGQGDGTGRGGWSGKRTYVLLRPPSGFILTRHCLGRGQARSWVYGGPPPSHRPSVRAKP